MTLPRTAGTSKESASDAATSATIAVAAIWTSPSRPMPAILPASRLRAGMRARRTSTVRLDFSSTTPLRTMAP